MGGILGVVIGLALTKYLPPWRNVILGSAPEGAIDILFVVYRSSLDDFSQDSVYVKTRSGDVYSVFQHEWRRLEPLPNDKPIAAIRFRDNRYDEPIVAITNQDEAFELADGHWKLLSDGKIPLEEDEPVACATEWEEPPPLGQEALDSVGVRFERPISAIERCYVLLDNGSLQVWTRATDVFTLMRIIGISTGTGIAIGIAIGILVARATTRNRLTHAQ